MKRFQTLFLIGILFSLASCDMTREITLSDNGSGTMVTTNDFSSIIGLAKMSGQGDKMNEQKAIDTIVSLATIVDSIPDITPEEKTLLKTGKLRLNMDLANEKFFTTLNFPFSSTEQLAKLDQLAQKVTQQTMQKQMGAEGGMPGMGEMPKATVDEYYTTTYSKGSIEKKVNKEKYAGLANDEGMQNLKKATEEGIPMNTTLIFNLPRPAKKAEGKSLKLSEDKKKVTITSSLEDFFDDASKLEFRIEY